MSARRSALLALVFQIFRCVLCYLAIRQVQMKEQILKGLLRERGADDGNEEVGSATAAHPAVGARADERRGSDGTWKRREDLLKTGAVTPLDALDDLTDGFAGKRRKTLQDYKIAEGMQVKLPRSRCPKTKPRANCSDGAEYGQESGRESAKVGDSRTAFTTDLDQGSLGRDPGIGAGSRVECPLCAQPIKVDDPAKPDVCLSRHMDRCTRSTRRTLRQRPSEEDGSRNGDGAGAKKGPANRRGPCPPTFAKGSWFFAVDVLNPPPCFLLCVLWSVN